MLQQDGATVKREAQRKVISTESLSPLLFQISNVINVITLLLIEKQTYQDSKSYHTESGKRKTKEEEKDGIDCETERERHPKRQTD